MTVALRVRDAFHGSWLLRAVGFLAVLAVGALSLRIVLVNAFAYVNWADAMSYAEGARRVYAGLSPYSEMQLSGPYPLDYASFGFGFVYPPSGGYLLAPFALGEAFWYAWNAASIAAVLTIVVLIVRRELGSPSVPVALAAGAIGVTIFQPGLTDLETGYLSPMVAAAVGAIWLWPRQSAAPALVFGLIKVFPAGWLLWTIRQGGSWKVPLAIAVVFFAVVTLAHPAWLGEWMVALSNAEPACPEFALPSFGCLGVPWVGYALAPVLVVLSWRAARDNVAFLLLALAVTVPLPDLYWGNLMVPTMAAIPLVIREWLSLPSRPPQPSISATTRSASSIE